MIMYTRTYTYFIKPEVLEEYYEPTEEELTKEETKMLLSNIPHSELVDCADTFTEECEVITN